MSVLRLKDGEDPPLPDPNLTDLDGGEGVSISATGRPQRKSRTRGGAAPFSVICCSDETVGFFKLKARNQLGCGGVFSKGVSKKRCYAWSPTGMGPPRSSKEVSNMWP